MKNLTIKVLLLLSFFNFIYADEYINFNDYVTVVSKNFNINIIVSEDIEQNFQFSYSKKMNKSNYISILTNLCNDYDLKIVNKGKYYFISKVKDKNEDIKLYNLTLNHINYQDIKDLFSYTKSNKQTSNNTKKSNQNITTQQVQTDTQNISQNSTSNTYEPIYITNNKSVIFYSTPLKYKRIKQLLKTLDIPTKQNKLHITIVSTNLNDLKEKGTQLEVISNTFENSSFFFDLIAYPFTVTNKISNSNKLQFDLFLKYLNQENISNILTSPILTLYDNKSVILKNVKNIPYLDSTTTIEDSTTQTTENINYKDVGLQIEIKPKIYDNFALLDFNLIYEDLIDTSNTPTTNKSEINQTLKIEFNKPIILTGINQSQNFKDISKIPLLGDLPILDSIFRYESNSQIDTNITIILELKKD